LILSSSTSVLAASEGEIVDLLGGGQGVFNVVPMAGVVSELEASIIEIAARAAGAEAAEGRAKTA
jgi:hypothetical protein